MAIKLIEIYLLLKLRLFFDETSKISGPKITETLSLMAHCVAIVKKIPTGEHNRELLLFG